MQGETRLNDYLVICDRSGLQCWNSELVTEWTGMRVLARFAEARHPQDFVRGVPDNPSVPNPRPDTSPVYLPDTITTLAEMPIILSDGAALTTIGG